MRFSNLTLFYRCLLFLLLFYLGFRTLKYYFLQLLNGDVWFAHDSLQESSYT